MTRFDGDTSRGWGVCRLARVVLDRCTRNTMVIHRLSIFFALGLATACGREAEHPERVRPPAPVTDFSAPVAQEVSGIDDQEFVAKAVSGGRFEVESSQRLLALETDPDAVAFAKMMVRDHERANQELEELAREKGFPMSAQLQPKHEEMLAQIDGAPLEQIGEIYLRLQESAHEEAVDLFERCARVCEDEDLRAFAERTLPILRSHLDHVKRRLPPEIP
jgi:putative membrane protein